MENTLFFWVKVKLRCAIQHTNRLSVLEFYPELRLTIAVEQLGRANAPFAFVGKDEVHILDNEFFSKIIFENENFAVKYLGPSPSCVDHVVVSFPDLIHPTGFDVDGWGESFFSKRRQPAAFLLMRNANWFQSEGFFEAMRSVRAYVGKSVRITSYGSSMGGYGAILSARSLQADHVLALCPQYTIQQDIVPFEHRYREKAREIGEFIHDVDSELSKKTNYTIVYDPTHNIDRRHASLFAASPNWAFVPFPGSAHGVLQTILEAIDSDTFLSVILNKVSPQAFRKKLRQGRRSSTRYLRRMGNLTIKRHQGLAKIYINHARNASLFKLVDRWQEALQDVRPSRPTIIIHPGLPKTGTTAIQNYFKSTNKKYRRRGVTYPLEAADPKDFSHAWLSKCMKEGNLKVLEEFLKQLPLDTSTLLLSDESLYVEEPLLSQNVREDVQALFVQYPVRIVYCERSLEKWKKSFYLQALKNKRPAHPDGANRLWGTSLTFKDFFNDSLAQQLTNIEENISNLAELFSADHVHSAHMKPGRDIIPDFCRSVGLRYFEEAGAVFKNISLSDLDGEILRQANQLPRDQNSLIKNLISLDARFDVKRARIAKVTRLAEIGRNMKWETFSYKPNPPLKYSRRDFNERLADLKNFLKEMELDVDI